jgi:NitT/TauT family transport system ATP-binding protein
MSLIPTLLQAQGLAFGWPGHAPLFEAVDLQVGEGEVVALLGGSGCGKSTLLRVLAGLVHPTDGAVRFNGQALVEPHPRAALLFQQPSLLPWLCVADNVSFGLDFERQPRLDAASRQRRVHAALEAVGLAHAGALRTTQLSGGMAQRVALARGLARQPVLLLADEPFSALDAITRHSMQTLLKDVVRREGLAVLLVTHDIEEALSMADRVLLMGPLADAQGSGICAQWTLPAALDSQTRQSFRAPIQAALHRTLRNPGFTVPA